MVPKAVQFYEFGGPEVLKVEEMPVEQPGPDEVREWIEACALNGLMSSSAKTTTPSMCGPAHAWRQAGSERRLTCDSKKKRQKNKVKGSDSAREKSCRKNNRSLLMISPWTV